MSPVARPKTTEELNEEFDALVGAAAELGTANVHELRAKGHFLIYQEVAKQTWRRKQYVMHTTWIGVCIMVLILLLFTYYRPTPVINRSVHTVFVPKRVPVTVVRWRTPGALLPQQPPPSSIHVTLSNDDDPALVAASRMAQMAVDWCEFGLSAKAAAACRQEATQAWNAGNAYQANSYAALPDQQQQYVGELQAMQVAAQGVEEAVTSKTGIDQAVGRFDGAAGALEQVAAGNP